MSKQYTSWVLSNQLFFLFLYIFALFILVIFGRVDIICKWRFLDERLQQLGSWNTFVLAKNLIVLAMSSITPISTRRALALLISHSLLLKFFLGLPWIDESWILTIFRLRPFWVSIQELLSVHTWAYLPLLQISRPWRMPFLYSRDQGFNFH